MTKNTTNYQTIIATVDFWTLKGCIAAGITWTAKGINFTPATAEKELNRRKANVNAKQTL